MAKDPILIWKLTSRPLSSNLSMEVKNTIFAQKNVKNNLNLGPNSTHVLREKAVQGLRLAIGLTAGNQGGYWTRNLLYCPAGRNVANSILTVQRSQADRPVLDAGVGFPNAFTGKEDARMATQILIADDDPTIRLLLRRLLEKQGDWQVCGEASNGVEAIEGVERFKPDVVVMDLAMPVMNGLQAGPEIAKAHPRLPMLLISVQEVSKQLAWEARNAGYRGAVTKSGGDEVLRGVEALLRHDMFFYADDGSSSNPAPG